MDIFPTNLLPPNPEVWTWRKISLDDLPALVDLSRAVLRTDGGVPFLFVPELIRERFLSGPPGLAIGAFDSDGCMISAAAVTGDDTPEIQRAVIVGQVHPKFRERGIGNFLMRWSREQARALLAAPVERRPGLRRVLQVKTESLSQSAERLYRLHGFERVDQDLFMRLKLDRPLPDWPVRNRVTLASWRPDLAEQFFQVYQEAFRERPGFPNWSAAEWIGRVTENDHKPEWSLLASIDEAPVGFIIGDIDLTSDPHEGHIWQVGVIPAWRRRGIATDLMIESMRRMQAEGAAAALLQVHTNNPEAIQVYARLGFEIIAVRARYERPD